MSANLCYLFILGYYVILTWKSIGLSLFLADYAFCYLFCSKPRSLFRICKLEDFSCVSN